MYFYARFKRKPDGFPCVFVIIDEQYRGHWVFGLLDRRASTGSLTLRHAPRYPAYGLGSVRSSPPHSSKLRRAMTKPKPRSSPFVVMRSPLSIFSRTSTEMPGPLSQINTSTSDCNRRPGRTTGPHQTPISPVNC